MNIVGAFFLKSGHFFKTLKKGGEDLPSPPAPSSSRQNTVMLDIWWHILIKFSKRLANTFEKIVNFYKGKFKTLPNIWDGAFWRNSQNPFTIFAKISMLDIWQGSGYAFELASDVEDVSFLNQFEYRS